MLAGAIPIYWGTKQVCDHFNEKSFIFVENSFENAIAKIRAVNENETLYSEMIEEPWVTERSKSLNFLQTYKTLLKTKM